MTSELFGSRMEVKKQTLAWVNDRRRELGLAPLIELPKGKRLDPASCPVARGLSNGWKAHTGNFTTTVVKKRFLRYDEKRTITHPRFVKGFIESFDNWEYPELIDRR